MTADDDLEVVDPDINAAVDLAVAALDRIELSEPPTPREAGLAWLVLAYAAAAIGSEDPDQIRMSLRGTAALTAAREALTDE